MFRLELDISSTYFFPNSEKRVDPIVEIGYNGYQITAFDVIYGVALVRLQRSETGCGAPCAADPASIWVPECFCVRYTVVGR